MGGGIRDRYLGLDHFKSVFDDLKNGFRVALSSRFWVVKFEGRILKKWF